MAALPSHWLSSSASGWGFDTMRGKRRATGNPRRGARKENKNKKHGGSDIRTFFKSSRRRIATQPHLTPRRSEQPSGGTPASAEPPLYWPGIFNKGNSCYMSSVLQAVVGTSLGDQLENMSAGTSFLGAEFGRALSSISRRTAQQLETTQKISGDN